MDLIKTQKFKPKVNQIRKSILEENVFMEFLNYYYFQLWTPASPGRVVELGSNPGTRGSALAVSWCLKRSRAGPWIAGSSLSYSLSLSLPPPSGTCSCLANDAVVSTVPMGTQVNTGLLILGKGRSEVNMASRVSSQPRREPGAPRNTGSMKLRTDRQSLGQGEIRLRRRSERSRVLGLVHLGLRQSDTVVRGQSPGLPGPSQSYNLQRFRGRGQCLYGRVQTQGSILKDMLQLSLGRSHLSLGRLHILTVRGHTLHEVVESLKLFNGRLDDITKEVITDSCENEDSKETNNKASSQPSLRSSHVEAKTETEATSPFGTNGIQCDIESKLYLNQSNVVLHIQACSSIVMSRAHFNPISGRAARNARICLYCVLIDSNAPSPQLSSKLSLCFSLSILT